MFEHREHTLYVRSFISDWLDRHKVQFIPIGDRIWEFAETRFEEFRSAELIAGELEREGFDVQRKAGGIPTAVVGSYGQGKPVIAILGEYDALSGLSQHRGEPRPAPRESGGNGHGCGHNLLGTGALAAAVGLRKAMERYGLPGTVRYYGCPAEEGGGGKGYMVRNGLFRDVDAALTWHPASMNFILSSSTLATCQMYFRFRGRSAHAAGEPHFGRSALDAVELTNVGCNYLREHIISEARIHYAITNAGGISPNVVPAEAEVLYKIRTPHSEQLAELYDRVCNVAKGAALMTGTELKIEFDAGSSEIIVNRTLEKLMHDTFRELGCPSFDLEETGFAAQIRDTLTESERTHQVPPELRHLPLTDRLEPYKPSDEAAMGSTDVGDVSWQVPVAQCWVACSAIGTPLHSWQAVSQFGVSIGHKGMLHAAKVMAAAAAELLLRPDVLKQAKDEHLRRVQGRAYHCPIPEGAVPKPVRKS
ncbi:amidohydrolase [Cohnella boryungensis]|uniref:Amidohydrolase n=1 Tax=Cohnella boryungensis TaxID=768479 RepID=A0ABV8S4Z4_9BACL